MVLLVAFLKHLIPYLSTINSIVILYDNATTSLVLKTILDASLQSAHQLVNVDVIQSHPDIHTPFFFVDIATRPILIVSVVSHSFAGHAEFLHNEVVDYYAEAHLILAHCATTIEMDLRPIFPTTAAIVVAILDRSGFGVNNVTTSIPAQWWRPSGSTLLPQLSSRLTQFKGTAMQRLHAQSLIGGQVPVIHLSLSVCSNLYNISIRGPRSAMFFTTFMSYMDAMEIKLSLYSHQKDANNASNPSGKFGNCFPVSVRDRSGRIARSIVSHPTWYSNDFMLVVPNWWHWHLDVAHGPRLTAARRALLFNGLLSLGIFASRWLLTNRRRRSTSVRLAADLAFDTLARVFGVAVPDGRPNDGPIALLGMMASIWGVMMCGFVSNLVFDMSLMTARWQPVFLTATDVWSHPWLPIVTGDLMQTGAGHIRNETGRYIYSMDNFDGREVWMYSLDEPETWNQPMFQQRYTENGTFMYRKIYNKNFVYVRQTLCTPLFLRPRLHLLSRVLKEAGLGKVPIDVEDYRRRQKIARQYDTDIQPTLEYTALRMTIGMYALLNAMAVGAFFVEVVSNVWIKRHMCTHE